MVKKVLFILVVCLMIFPIISATNTEIKIKTMPFYEVHLSVLDASSSENIVLYGTMNVSDLWGDITFNYSSDKSYFNLRVIIKEQGSTSRYFDKEYTDNFVAGQPIYLVAANDESDLPFPNTPSENPITPETIIEINETPTEEPAIIEENLTETTEEPEKQTKITGFSIKDVLTNKITYISIGAIVVLFGSFFLVKWLKKKKKSPRDIKIKKLSELQEEKSNKVEDYKKIIEDSEKKIKEAQDKIKNMKETDKIAEMKKKIIEDEKELMRLRREKD